MKSIFTLVLACLGIWAGAQEEHELIIEPTDVGVLNVTIFGDTTETGERADPDRVYVLRRGAPYLLTESMRWSGYHIRIKAEEGDGPRPLIIFNVDAGGETLDQLFRLDDGADLTISGLHISCRDILGNNVLRAIRMSGDKGKVVVDDCVIEETGQAGFRLNADSIKVFISNSIFNRIGLPTDPANGRFMDNRGHPIDSIWIENSVVYDVTQRYYRPGSGSILHNGYFNQNTFVASGDLCFTWGEVDNLIFMNNIIAHPMFLGVSIDTSSELDYVMELDTFEASDNIWISYNNIFSSPAYDAAIPTTNADGDTLVSGSSFLFDPVLSEALMQAASATDNINEILGFTDEPNVPVQFIEAITTDTSGTGDGLEGAGRWDFSDLSPDDTYSALGQGDIERYTSWHDFSYPENTASYTGGNEGQPLGANLTAVGTDAEDYFISDNILFYPNPAREQVFIQNLDRADLEQISLYDLSGNRLIHQKVQGTNAVFHLLDLPRGTYVLTVQDYGGKLSSRKIVKH